MDPIAPTPIHCTLWKDTGGFCCPDGTHQTDCVHRHRESVDWYSPPEPLGKRVHLPLGLWVSLFASHLVVYAIGVAVALYAMRTLP